MIKRELRQTMKNRNLIVLHHNKINNNLNKINKRLKKKKLLLKEVDSKNFMTKNKKKICNYNNKSNTFSNSFNNSNNNRIKNSILFL